MKNLCSCFLIMLVFTQACKKDKDKPSESPNIHAYDLDDCLLSSITIKAGSNSSVWKYYYDAQRRLVLRTKDGSPGKMTYVYTGDKMIVEEIMDWGRGNTTTRVTTNYLDSMGYISWSINFDSTQTFYTYNEDGYLIRRLEKGETGGYVSGTSYYYANGNRMGSYELSVDAETGETTGIESEKEYTYYDNLRGKMEEVYSRNERLGKGSKNELKSISSGSGTISNKYVIASDGMPESMIVIYSWGEVKQDMKWKCN